jgi:sorbitol-specific phosphotransferase system component IIC
MYKILITILVLIPTVASADLPKTPETANQIFTGFSVGNLAGLIPVLILVGLVTFLASLVKFVGAGDNEEKRAQARKVMIYGIIVLFVMVSIWGFVNILTQSFFGKNFGLPNYLPKLQK